MRQTFRVFRAAGLRFNSDGCAFLAQAIAYNALFALVPLALLAIAFLAFIYGSQDGQMRALSVIDEFAPAFHDLFAENLKTAIDVRGISGLIGFAALIWSGKNLFMALAYALNKALGVPAGRPLVHDIALSIVMLPVIGVLLIVATALPPLVTVVSRIGWFASIPLVQLTSFAVSFLLVFGVAAILYTFLPNRTVAWGFGLPGAMFTATCYELAQIAFTIYTAHATFLHIYGVVSTVLALLLWFYLMGAIFLYGAELSAAYAKDEGTVVIPAPLATPSEATLERTGPTSARG